MDIRNVGELIGNTPFIELKSFERTGRKHTKIFAKLESFNLSGSAKDRAVLKMLKAAKPWHSTGRIVVEPTSGNTGISLAALAPAFSLKAVLVMPENMSAERRALLKAYGAELVLSSAEEGMAGACRLAKELIAAERGAFGLNQFDNAANPAGQISLGREIWAQSRGEVDILVAGIGTGGTISGAAGYLKRVKKGFKAVGVEPLSSPFLTAGRVGAHKIQGIGAGFKPKNYNPAVVDEVVAVSDGEAFEGCRLLSRREGLFVGISSGAAFAAALKLAERSENAGKNIVVIFPDGGERYLSCFSGG